MAAPAVLLLSSCAAFSANVPKSPAASAQVIPWVDTKPAAYHQGLAVPAGQAPQRACKADDLAATYRGAMGLTNEMRFVAGWHFARMVRVADGTDEVMRRNIASSLRKGDVSF